VNALGERLRNLRSGNLRLTNLHSSDAAVAAYGAARSIFSRIGLQLVVKSFYSPIPDLAALPAGVWDRRSDLAGIDFDLDRQLALVERLAPRFEEFDPPQARAEPGRYHRSNPSYPAGDADLLYALTRELAPTRIIELGSGFTTLVLAEALGRNGSGRLVSFDPFPGVASEVTNGAVDLRLVPAQEVPLAEFEELRDGDFLIVDTTHTVKVAGDVNRIVLDILPRLAAGVYIHFHDIFLPYEYPREWPERFGLYWSEQYLLQAFLALNPSFEIVVALHALSRERRARLEELIPALSGASPAAFWIRRMEG
jgi:hypothetical protein